MHLGVVIMVILGLLILAGIAIAIIVCASVSYRRHLNRVVERKERGLHTSAVDPWTVAKVVFAAVVLILMCTVQIKLSVLRNVLDDMRERNQSIEQQLDSIKYSIDQMSKASEEEKKLLQEFDYSFDSIDYEKKTVKIYFLVVPKEFSESTIVEVAFGSKVATLKNQGGVFEGTLDADIFASSNYSPIVSIKNGEKVQTEDPDNSFNGRPADYLFDMFSMSAHSIHLEYGKDPTNVKVECSLEVYGSKAMMSQDIISKRTLLIRSGDTLLKAIPFEIKGDCATIEIDEEFKIQEDAPIQITLEYTLDGGWTVSHDIHSTEWTQDEGDFAPKIVKDKDGKVLFEE